MKRSAISAAALTMFCASPALGHRIDEYLQATTLLVSSGRLQLEVRLAPGSEIAQKVLDSIDLDRNGVLSADEQGAYALQLVHDLELTLDGRPVSLSLTALRFDRIPALRDGTGEIRLSLAAELASGGEVRRLLFENRHRPEISAYLVNSLVPDDPAIRIAKQERNYKQSVYELEYFQQSNTGEASAGVSVFWVLAIVGFILAAGDEVRRRIRSS